MFSKFENKSREGYCCPPVYVRNSYRKVTRSVCVCLYICSMTNRSTNHESLILNAHLYEESSQNIMVYLK